MTPVDELSSRPAAALPSARRHDGARRLL